MVGRVYTQRTQRAGNVATITLDNPGKLNAMDKAMWLAMAETLEQLAADTTLRCIVITGAGKDAFASGADIAEFETERSNSQQAASFAKHVHRAMHALRDCPIPTLAAIRGVCAGGGLELAAYCDLRLCNFDARVGIPVNRLGATLIYTEVEALLHLATPQVALEILLEGRMFSADEAYARGLVTRIVPADKDFDAELAKTIGRIVDGAPLAARLHKKFIRRLESAAPLAQSEIDESYSCFDSKDYRTGFSAFVDKRKPEFEGK